MAVDAATVLWLREGVLHSISTDSAAETKWGINARETEIISCLALQAAAALEAARQQSFLAGPIAVEVHDVPGLRSDLMCKPVTITCDRLGYESGVDVFVIGVDEREAIERTILTVLRRLT